MKEIDLLRTGLTILGIVVAGVATYFTTIYKLKEAFRDKLDEQNKQINDLKVEIERLKSKDDLQQQFIDQFKQHVLNNLQAFYKALEHKESKK